MEDAKISETTKVSDVLNTEAAAKPITVAEFVQKVGGIKAFNRIRRQYRINLQKGVEHPARPVYKVGDKIQFGLGAKTEAIVAKVKVDGRLSLVCHEDSVYKVVDIPQIGSITRIGDAVYKVVNTSKKTVSFRLLSQVEAEAAIRVLQNTTIVVSQVPIAEFVPVPVEPIEIVGKLSKSQLARRIRKENKKLGKKGGIKQ